MASEAIIVVSAAIIVVLSLSLRRALVDRPYRSRALWTAVGALAVVSLMFAQYVDTVFGQVPNNLTAVIVEDSVWGFSFLGLFGWLVTNVNVSISADYFNRDALAWKRGGRILAPLILVVLYVFISLPPWWIPSDLVAVNTGSVISAVTAVVFVGIVVYAASVLTITVRRINDGRIRTFTKWLVVSILSVPLLVGAPQELWIFVATLWAFSMYRSVSSLAIKTKILTA